ncbi:MAG: hypothetical protein K1X53_17350 [Candidatus Sumerlaeaceae bacterium]|nr:hypothetical protein [Candidatus Sumerlaeaceae bacterium]
MHSYDLRNLSPVHTIGFGEKRWQSHLGGSFHGPEEQGDVSWNWAAATRCWCVLPHLDPTHDYAVLLEAAPSAPFGAELRELTVLAGETELVKRVVPVTEKRTTLTVTAQQLGSARTNFGELELRWVQLPQPELDIAVNDQACAHLAYQVSPEIQIREFLLRHQLLASRNILSFTPNLAITQRDLANSTDDRCLSFRFYRMSMFELPD